ncbi:DegT/DnrJ/EryC1/StrS family aminotransferase [Desulforhopalus sp. 52FAK]
MTSNRFSSWPSFTVEEAQAIQHVLLSNKVNYWTGTECRKFEQEFAAWCGAEHAIALTNGTLALDLALKVLNIGPGDEVVVTPRSFIASASCVVTVGATPVFAEVDADSQNITVESIRAVLTPHTKAVICVHLAGWSCDMDPIMALADEKDLYVIEDCAQAHGATYKGKSVGSIGHFGAWSFCQDKIMTTGGEGGMLTTNCKDWWEQGWAYKDHGKSWAAVYERKHRRGFRWLHESFGTNWRMMEMQAAIGRIQLKRMLNWTTQRRRNAQLIWDSARKLSGLRVPVVPSYIGHAAYKCYIFVEPERLQSNWNRDRIMAEINQQGVPCYSGACSEIYMEKAFDNTGWRPTAPLHIARELGENSLMFLVHPTLTGADISLTCDVLEEVLRRASRIAPEQ